MYSLIITCWIWILGITEQLLKVRTLHLAHLTRVYTKKAQIGTLSSNNSQFFLKRCHWNSNPLFFFDCDKTKCFWQWVPLDFLKIVISNIWNHIFAGECLSWGLIKPSSVGRLVIFSRSPWMRPSVTPRFMNLSPLKSQKVGLKPINVFFPCWLW